MCIHKYSKIKHGFKNKYLTLKYLKFVNCLIELSLLIINSFLIKKRLTRKIIICKRRLYFIPLKVVSQKILKYPNVFKYVCRKI